LTFVIKGFSVLSILVRVQVRVASLRTDRGATAVEYAIMVSLVAIVIVASVTLLGKNLSSLFNRGATSV